MNKNLLLDIFGESSALRNWVAQQLIVGLDYPMSRQTIESLLAESPVFRNWALDQFDGGFNLTLKKEGVQKVIDKVVSLFEENGKIPAIKYLRDASEDESIREGLLKRYKDFVRIFEIENPHSLAVYRRSANDYSSVLIFSLHFAKNLAEHIHATED